MESKTLNMVIPWGILALIAALLIFAPPKAFVPYYDIVSVILVFPALIYVALHFEPTGAGSHICKLLGTLSYAMYAIHDSLYHSVENIAEHRQLDINYYAPWAGLSFLAFLVWLCLVSRQVL